MLSKVFVVFVAAFCLIGNISGAEVENAGKTCEETASNAKTWLIILIVVPSLLNIASVILLIFSMILIRRLKSVVQAISSSTHWLTRTAIRVGLGPTAKKALIEYAKGKPEFKRLLG